MLLDIAKAIYELSPFRFRCRNHMSDLMPHSVGGKRTNHLGRRFARSCSSKPGNHSRRSARGGLNLPKEAAPFPPSGGHLSPATQNGLAGTQKVAAPSPEWRPSFTCYPQMACRYSEGSVICVPVQCSASRLSVIPEGGHHFPPNRSR